MADFLAEKDWKDELKKHKDVKETGLSEPLRNYVKYKEKDAEKALQALNLVVTKGEAAKRVYKDNDKLKKYVGSMVDEAKEQITKLEKKVESEEKEEEESEGPDKALNAALKRAKTGRMFFAVVAKGASDGKLLLDKAKIKPSDIADAKKASGGTAVFRGICQGEDGKHVFLMAKEPPATLEKLIKTLGKTQAGMMLKVECRMMKGLEDVGDTPDDNPEENTERTKAYQTAQQKWTTAKTQGEKSVAALRLALVKSEDTRAVAVARGLERVFGQMPPLENALTRLINAAQGETEEKVRVAQGEAKTALANCLNYVMKDPLIADVQRNPFVKVELQKSLGAVLLEASKTCPGLK